VVGIANPTNFNLGGLSRTHRSTPYKSGDQSPHSKRRLAFYPEFWNNEGRGQVGPACRAGLRRACSALATKVPTG
jgi:hypothetical protein